jgi:putative transcriptional regulator
MNIHHHLSDDILMAYSAGQLPEAFSLVVATHISMCDDCRAALHAFDAVGGALMDEGDLADLSADSLQATMARISGAGPRSMNRPARPRPGVFPAPLRDAVGGDLADVRWRPVGMGVRQAILPTSGRATVRLLSIPAGQAMPHHGHRGMEMTLVLQGAFRDQSERFQRGDVEIATEEMDHTPVAEAGPDCICLAAADAPLRFNSMVPRLLQPLFRI